MLLLLIFCLSTFCYLSLGHNDQICALGGDRSKHRPLRMLITVSNNYFDSFLNWLVFYYDVCGNDLSMMYFLCIDTQTEILMQKYSLKCSYSLQFGDSFRSMNRIWWTRMLITLKLLRKGFDVISSDIDAIWLKNPFTEINKLPKADVIVTRGKYPEVISEKYGASLCMGFIYIKTSDLTIDLWHKLVNSKSPHFNPDDQRELNRYLSKGDIKFPLETLDYINSTTTDIGRMSLPRGELYVAVLPQNLYRRECDGVNTMDVLSSIIVHCNSDKKGASKQLASSAFGIWKLKTNWKDVKFRTFDQFIKNVRVL